MAKELEILELKPTQLFLDVYEANLQCGFPSDPGDVTSERIDVAQFLIPDFDICRAVLIHGESMTEAGFSPGDVAILNTALEPHNGDVVVAEINGEQTMKFYCVNEEDEIWLTPCSKRKNFTPIRVKDTDEFRVLGVIVSSMKNQQKGDVTIIKNQIKSFKATLPVEEIDEESPSDFASIFAPDVDKSALLKKLHELIDDKKGKAVLLVFRCAYELHYFTKMPTYAQAISEFPYIGTSSNYYRYLNYEFFDNETLTVKSYLSE